MIVTRRSVIVAGGVFLAGQVVGAGAGSAAGAIHEIVMRGNADGSRVWFDPVGLRVEPGSTIRWINLDPGNSHTATAYHPDVMNRPRRIPAGAEPWDSDYLLPDETFSVTLTRPGVYDFYCVPHEHAGMVGRIVVGDSTAPDWTETAGKGEEPLPEIAASDPLLVDLARQGNEGAVRVLVQRYNGRLYRIARAVLRNDADAEEVVQEAHLSAFSSLDRFRGESSFATWITRIAMNAAFGRLRRGRAAVELDSLRSEAAETARVITFPSAQLNPEQAMARSQVRELLEQVVEELPDPFRLVLVLRDVEEMSVEETARHLGLKPATVKTRLYRARKMMRAGLAERMAGALPDLFPFAGARCERMADRVVEAFRARKAAERD